MESPAARVLVLGSMPGVASLRLQQYYGHPQNVFWKIVGHVLGFDPAATYAQRMAALIDRRVALWDVLAVCVREGSLDSSIDLGSMVSNDFVGFFARHPAVRRVCFNGATAESAFRKHVLPQLAQHLAVDYIRLPSTSPAHAGMPYGAKLQAWRAITLDDQRPPTG